MISSSKSSSYSTLFVYFFNVFVYPKGGRARIGSCFSNTLPHTAVVKHLRCVYMHSSNLLIVGFPVGRRFLKCCHECEAGGGSNQRDKNGDLITSPSPSYHRGERSRAGVETTTVETRCQHSRSSSRYKRLIFK